MLCVYSHLIIFHELSQGKCGIVTLNNNDTFSLRPQNHAVHERQLGGYKRTACISSVAVYAN